MWHRRAGGLTYTAAAWHKLLPPPSRISNNALVTAVSVIAAVWRPGGDDVSNGTDTIGQTGSSGGSGGGGLKLTRRTVSGVNAIGSGATEDMTVVLERQLSLGSGSGGGSGSGSVGEAAVGDASAGAEAAAAPLRNR